MTRETTAPDAAATVAASLWEADAPLPARTRAPLSRKSIVAAAVTLADADGLDAVSMPRLARALGSAPMSLYRHVPNKEALIGLMLDAAIGPPPEPNPDAPWRDRLAAWARANRDVFRRHPWTLALVTGGRPMGPNECAWGEAALAVVVDAGLRPGGALRVLLLVNGYVRGASAAFRDRTPSRATLESSGRRGEFPLLAPLLERDEDAADEGEDPFEFGLARVLDGITVYLGVR